jgi:proline iminopeptidase
MALAVILEPCAFSEPDLRGQPSVYHPYEREFESANRRFVEVRRKPLVTYLRRALFIWLSVAVLDVALAAMPSTDAIMRASMVKTFATSCGNLAYQEFGTGSPIVVLAGGPGMNPAYMAPVAKMLSSEGRRAVLFHQRGTGGSEDASSCPTRLTVNGAIADLDALRRQLRLQKLYLAGHSWGGMLAMAYAQRYPDRVSALLLLDTGPMQAASFPIEEEVIRNRLTATEQAALNQAKNGAPTEKIERRALFAHAENARLLEKDIPIGEPLWYETAGNLMGSDLGNFDVTRGMRTLKAPVMLIFGREDPGFFTIQQIRDQCRQAKVIVIEDAGHYPWMEQPAQMGKSLEDVVATMP